MHLLLDTSAYAAFLRGHPEAKDLVQQATRLVLCPIVLGELYSGFLAGSQRRRNESLLHDFLASPRVDIVMIDDGTSQRYATIWLSLRSAGTPIPTNDVWIAAVAMQHGLELLTADAHFAQVPQILVRRL